LVDYSCREEGIEKVEIVFKDGVSYDLEKVIRSVQGLVRIR